MKISIQCVVILCERNGSYQERKKLIDAETGEEMTWIGGEIEDKEQIKISLGRVFIRKQPI